MSAAPRRPLPRPGSGGIATLLGCGQGPVSAIRRGAVAVSGIPLDGFADTPGAAEGCRGTPCSTRAAGTTRHAAQLLTHVLAPRILDPVAVGSPIATEGQG